MKNLDLNYFGNQTRIISGEDFENWSSETFPASNFVSIYLRTSLRDISIIKILSSIFCRVYSVNILESENGVGRASSSLKSLQLYRVNLELLKPFFWNDFEKDLLNFYCLHLVKLLDWELCPSKKHTTTKQFVNLVDTMEEYFSYILSPPFKRFADCNVFFHSGMLEYLMERISKKRSHFSSRVVDDMYAIHVILRTPHKLRKVLSLCSEFDATYISDLLIQEYGEMRKDF